MTPHFTGDSRVRGRARAGRTTAGVVAAATLALFGCQIKDAHFFDPLTGKSDVDPPTIIRLLPTDAATMSGLAIVTPQIRFSVQDTNRSNGARPSGVASVKIAMDGQDLPTTNDSAGVYSASIATAVNGPKVFTVVARDSAGNIAQSSSSFRTWNQRPIVTINATAVTQPTSNFVELVAISGGVAGTGFSGISIDISKPGSSGNCLTQGPSYVAGTDPGMTSSSSLAVPLNLANAFSTNILAFNGRAPGSSGTATATYCVSVQATDSTVDGTGKPTAAEKQTASTQVIWQGAERGFADGFTRNQAGAVFSPVVLILSNGQRTTSSATGYYFWLNLPEGSYTQTTGANSGCPNGNIQFSVRKGVSSHTNVICP